MPKKSIFHSRMPFDWKTPSRYVITCSIQFVAWLFLLTNCSCILVFLGGVCWMLLALVEDMGEDLRSLNNIDCGPAELKRKFYDIIQFHSTIMQLSQILVVYFNSTCKKLLFSIRFAYDFSYIYEIIITGYYLWSVSTICSTLLVIHIEMVKYIIQEIGKEY